MTIDEEIEQAEKQLEDLHRTMAPVYLIEMALMRVRLLEAKRVSIGKVSRFGSSSFCGPKIGTTLRIRKPPRFSTTQRIFYAPSIAPQVHRLKTEKQKLVMRLDRVRGVVRYPDIEGNRAYIQW